MPIAITGAVSPWPGLVVDCLAAGIGLYARLSFRPLDQRQDFDTGLLIERRQQEGLDELSRRPEAATVKAASKRKIQ